ncbi:MAG: lipopolysaccharide heptosyltransferase I [Planctomycetes bacterium]|nr:lipopolysaccharide heptosyltransferase I [Planctomycetota bacterium]
MTHDYKNILIIKPSAMGDVVHAMPVLASLRAAFPDARISWLVRNEFAPLLECVSGLDEIVLFDRKLLGKWFYSPAAFKALRGFMRSLKNNRYDLVLDLQGLFRTAFFAWVTDSAKRIGMVDCREFAGFFYSHRICRPLNSMHLLDYYHALLADAGVDAVLATESYLNTPEEAKVSVRQKLEQAGIPSKDYFVLMPSSAHFSKCWPVERFVKLAETIHQQFGAAIVVIGTEKDRSIVDAIKTSCQSPVVDLANRTTILELIALLQNAKGVVSNDTGPGHIAAAMHVPTVLIFGHTNPMRVGPYRRPECIAAIEADNRPKTIESNNPKHSIENVPLELVLNKLKAQLKPKSLNDSE